MVQVSAEETVTLVKFGVDLLVTGQKGRVAHALVVGIKSDLDFVYGESLDSLEKLLGRVVGLKGDLLLADRVADAFDEFDQTLIFLVGEHDAVEHRIVVYLVRAGLYHGDQVGGGSDCDGHLIALALLRGGVDDVFAVNQTEGNAGDGAVPGDLGDGNGDGRAEHGRDLGRAVRIDRHDRGDHGNVVAHILGEQRADRTVDDAGGKHGLFGRSALSSLPGAGDLADGIELLLIVHGEREEIHALAGLVGHGGSAEHVRAAVADHAGTAGELRHFAGLDDKRSAGDLGFKNLEIFEHLFHLSIYIFTRKPTFAMYNSTCRKNV